MEHPYAMDAQDIYEVKDVGYIRCQGRWRPVDYVNDAGVNDADCINDADVNAETLRLQRLRVIWIDNGHWSQFLNH